MSIAWQLPQHRLPTEHEEQKHFVRWFRQRYPLVLIFAVPNGEKRSKTVAARLKQEGVTKGVPDLYVPEWKLWIEMKRQKKSRVEPEQKAWHVYLRSIGDSVVVPKGSDAAQEAVMTFVSQRQASQR